MDERMCARYKSPAFVGKSAHGPRKGPTQLSGEDCSTADPREAGNPYPGERTNERVSKSGPEVIVFGHGSFWSLIPLTCLHQSVVLPSVRLTPTLEASPALPNFSNPSNSFSSLLRT